MLKDKNGKAVQGGDIVLVDEGLVGRDNFLLRVYYVPSDHVWLGEKLTGEPTPQNLNGLGHRITVVWSKRRGKESQDKLPSLLTIIDELQEECRELRIENGILKDKLRKRY